MKVTSLCASEETRLCPLTYAAAKHLFPVAVRRVIEAWSEGLHRLREEVGFWIEEQLYKSTTYHTLPARNQETRP